jgi:Queuosine biosynthesis protein QueC
MTVNLTIGYNKNSHLSLLTLSTSLLRFMQLIVLLFKVHGKSRALPVRHLELLSATPFQDKFSGLLEWATGKRWLFDFCKRLDPGRRIEQPLLSSSDPHVGEVTLWSGGLDALAGLYTRLKANPEEFFMLFGTGSSDNSFDRQEQVFKALQHSFPNRLNLCQVPIRFSESSLHRKNKISRARGVVFTLLGSACAYLMGQKVLNLYENGVGAINLPYRKSAIGLDHSRSVHPLTLLKVSDTISELLGKEFKVQNPFLFWTKAEMCKALSEDGRVDLPQLTKLCDSPHRQKPVQCGYCSSCILRKQALAASLTEDTTRYVVPHGETPAGDTKLHLRHMLAQVSAFRDLFKNSQAPDLQWKALTQRFLELEDIVDGTARRENLSSFDMQKRLIRLYQTYVAEWTAVEHQVMVSLLNQTSTQKTSNDCLSSVQ